MEVDSSEDFPPLPKSVKPTRSPTLRKITQAKEQIEKPFNSDARNGLAVEISGPSSSRESIERVASPILLDGNDPAGQETPTVLNAPPPSSAELSTAGNTAPSTPIIGYARPRITPQTLHERLLHANATLSTSQDGHDAELPRSTPASPLRSPTPIVVSDHLGNWSTSITGETADSVTFLDITIQNNEIPKEHLSEG